MLESFEKVPVQIYKTPVEGSNAVAAQIASLIKREASEKPAVCFRYGYRKYSNLFVQGISATS